MTSPAYPLGFVFGHRSDAAFVLHPALYGSSWAGVVYSVRRRTSAHGSPFLSFLLSSCFRSQPTCFSRNVPCCFASGLFHLERFDNRLHSAYQVMRELGSDIAPRFTVVLMVLVIFAILLWNFLASDAFCADGLG